MTPRAAALAVSCLDAISHRDIGAVSDLIDHDVQWEYAYAVDESTGPTPIVGRTRVQTLIARQIETLDWIRFDPISVSEVDAALAFVEFESEGSVAGAGYR